MPVSVSVLMSVYNGERFVRDAVLSILNQTFRDFEFLVIDDASTDATPRILSELAFQDARIRVITNASNLGLTKSLNLALRQAQGDLIARMDADDIALPTRLEKQISYLNAHHEIGVVGTAYEWIDEAAKPTGRPVPVTDSNELKHALPRTNPLFHGSTLIKYDLLKKVGGYDERYPRAQDYDLWLRLMPHTLFANLPEVLMQKRLLPGMISYQSERTQLRCAVRARRAALKRGDIPWWTAIHLVKPFVASLLPRRVVRWTRIHLFGQRQYEHLR